ncbi:hypothetical protein PLESTB_001105100 [Pleodorina starrii]|uniref:Uncharacterized protein n=1 Tax=Pleodorina starrii TaxID=330485 RepID=A0A9W6BQC2_9CHLO|nr:hypothetical protein PLESTB_001105100 [Pleodorina starrii]
MPRQRQRIVFCDCFDCRDRPEVSLTPEQLDAATAVARQEPPPKALLLYATGFVVAADGATNLDACTLPHCNLVVREGNLGLLAVRAAEEAAGQGPAPAMSELSQLLGVYQVGCVAPPSGWGGLAPQPPQAPATPRMTSPHAPLTNHRVPLWEVIRPQSSSPSSSSGGGGEGSLPSLGARFKGMQAALGSTSAVARQLAQRLGVAVVERLCLGTAGQGREAAAAATTTGADAVTAAPVAPASGGADGTAGRAASLGLPDAAAFAREVSSELGAAEGSSGRDLLLLHLDLDDLRGAAALPAAAAAPGGGAAAEPAPDADGGAEAGGADGAADGGADAEAEADARWDAGCEGLEWIDSLVKALLALPEIRERTLLVLMLSPAGHPMPGIAGQGGVGTGSGGGGGALLQPGGAMVDPSAAVVTPRNLAQVGRGGGAAAALAAAAAVGTAGAGAGGALAVLDASDFPLVSRPVQSFELLGMGRVETDAHAPLLVARRLPGVVRRDRAERLGYKEALTVGGGGAILVDRLLPEVAYKIGRSPKYGA